MANLTASPRTTQPTHRHVYTALTWSLRTAVALNFVRFALSFDPRFEGTAHSAGTIDRLLGSDTWFGFFRPDFAWLIVSTIVIFAASFYFARVSEQYHRARLDVFLCRVWTAAFVIYIIKLLFTGVLYPG